jgi:integrase
MPRAKLTQSIVDNLIADPGRGDRTIFWDETQPGFGVMVTPSGARSYVVQYRQHGVSRRLTLKADSLSLVQARKEARKHQGDIERGIDPVVEERKEKERAEAAKEGTLAHVVDDYVKREKSKIRTMPERERIFRQSIIPVLGSYQLPDIGRSDITKMLDKIEDDSRRHPRGRKLGGAVAATKALAVLSALFSWYSARHDTFRSPIVRGMARTRAHERARERTLSDDEIAMLLRTVGAKNDAFSALIEFLLLTGCRRGEAANMQWSEIDGDAWTIPGRRTKIKKDVLIPLSRAARDVLARIPKIAGCPWVFSTNGRKPVTDFVGPKVRLDKATGLKDWRLHDLRRTARTLLSRAGVAPDVAERCLGHVVGGIVRNTYDRHAYLNEKREAFEKLAAEIDRIKRTA